MVETVEVVEAVPIAAESRSHISKAQGVRLKAQGKDLVFKCLTFFINLQSKIYNLLYAPCSMLHALCATSSFQIRL